MEIMEIIVIWLAVSFVIGVIVGKSIKVMNDN